jgi:hypothetical protein
VSFLGRVRAGFQIRTCPAARQKDKTGVNYVERSVWVGSFGCEFRTQFV